MNLLDIERDLKLLHNYFSGEEGYEYGILRKPDGKETVPKELLTGALKQLRVIRGVGRKGKPLHQVFAEEEARKPPSVFQRQECVHVYCPHPEDCQSANRCLRPADKDHRENNLDETLL